MDEKPNSGIQKKLSRVRPPKINISFDVETGDAIEKKELPYTVLLVSDSADTQPFAELENDVIDLQLFNTSLAELRKDLAEASLESEICQRLSAWQSSTSDDYPHSVLLLDLALSNSDDDQALLLALNKVCCHTCVPCIAFSDVEATELSHINATRFSALEIIQRLDEAMATYAWPATYIEGDSHFQHMLCAMRFAQYISYIAYQNNITGNELEAYLNSWITQYVLLDDKTSEHIKAQFPLRSAAIEVIEDKTIQRITLSIKPYFQLSLLGSDIRIEISKACTNKT